MASNQTLTPADRNAQADQLAADLAGGKVQWWDGSQPADPSVAATTQTKLVEFTLPDPLEVAVAEDGTTQFVNVTPALPLAGGNASWFRALKADGTPKRDGTIGTSDADLVVDTVAIVIGKAVTMAGSITQPATAG